MLSKEELNRYNRQIICQDWGESGQEKVKDATIFIAGVGGLGGPVSIYLAAAGIGKLRICDNGRVEHSNLNRQVLYNDGHLNEAKVVAAKDVLSTLNPHIEVEHFQEEITHDSVHHLVGNSALIIDCLDNFATRYILNDFALSRKLPLVYGGVEGLAGQITFIHTPETPCLRCMIPEAPPPQRVFPIVGTTAGIIGCLEANEALKYITGIGSTLKGILMIWDGVDTNFHRIEVVKDPNCPACGKKE
jgi:molybdopterin/thiamine biosynthesis adenylyltransferase